MANANIRIGARAALGVALLSLVALGACTPHVEPKSDPARAARAASALNAGAPVLVATGDIASCRDEDRAASMRADAVGALAREQLEAAEAAGSPVAVPALGNLAYEDGSAADYDCFARAWEGLNRFTLPVPGDRDYRTSATALPYYAYWQELKGDSAAAVEFISPLRDYVTITEGQYYYSFDWAGWHIVALDSETPAMDAQLAWLAADLQATAQPCVLAFWHRPRFSSAVDGGNPGVDALYRQLYQADATLVLNSHDRHYERFAPQTPDGDADPEGLAQFIVGTGGKGLQGSPAVRSSFIVAFEEDLVAANSEARVFGSYGVLRLQLLPGGYAWEFIDLNRHVRDSGRAPCVARAAAPQPTS